MNKRSETLEDRSRIMRAVKGRDTKPEMLVRRAVYALGYRYRLHRRDLPGSPDLVFSTRRKVIFVNGCFWHGHTCKRGARLPKANRDYWIAKIGRNVARDAASLKALKDDGWRSLVLWECEIGPPVRLSSKLKRFLR
jgi:DNA mismatch endonuclease (patch repair protein)